MKLFLSLGLLTLSSVAQSNDIYVGMDYVYGDVAIDGDSAHPTNINVKAGVEVFENIYLEGQYGVSSSDDDLYRMNFDVEKNYATFLRFQSPDAGGFSADISLGYSWNDLAVTGPEETYNGVDSYQGFAWGIALNQALPFYEPVRLRLGYQSLYSDSDFKIAGFTLGFTYTF